MISRRSGFDAGAQRPQRPLLLRAARRWSGRNGVVLVLALAGLMTGAVTVTTDSASAASSCLRTVRLGTSVQGRPIVACERGNPALRPLLVIGEIHGDEPAGRTTADRLMTTAVSSRVHLWVIATINPDGHAARTRKNAHGVDLNRNFPYGWQRRTGTYASGPRPASEPETRAVMAFIKSIKPHTTVIAHQPFNLVDISTKGDPRVSRRLAALMRMRVGSLATSGVPGATTYSGVLTAWANDTVPASTAVTFEFSANPSAYQRNLLAASLMTLSKERALHRYRSYPALTWAPDSVVAGAQFHVQGLLRIEARAGGAFAGEGRSVSLLRRTSTTTWSRVWSGRTGEGGRVTPTLAITGDSCLVVRFYGDLNHNSATSRELCVRVRT